MKKFQIFLVAILLRNLSCPELRILGVHEYLERHGVEDLVHASAVMQSWSYAGLRHVHTNIHEGPKDFTRDYGS